MKDKLTQYFSRSEFACKCGCGTNTVDAELLAVLSYLRIIVNKPIIILSGHRCAKHNDFVGGAEKSQHLIGKAVDIKIPGVSTEEIFSFLDVWYNNKYGIGLYKDFVHIDVRAKKARWG